MRRRILIAGAGRMGRWFITLLSNRHEVAVIEPLPERREFSEKVTIIDSYGEIRSFSPSLVINCAGLEITVDLFRELDPFLKGDTVLCDIASLKRGVEEYYRESGRRFVSLHPMFGPTLADMSSLQGYNMLIVNGSDKEYANFFRECFRPAGLAISEVDFNNHDEIMASALSAPMLSSIVFAASLNGHESVPGGSSYRSQRELAMRLLDGDSEIMSLLLTNISTVGTIDKMIDSLTTIRGFVDKGDKDSIYRAITELSSSLRSG